MMLLEIKDGLCPRSDMNVWAVVYVGWLTFSTSPRAYIWRAVRLDVHMGSISDGSCSLDGCDIERKEGGLCHHNTTCV